MMTHSHFTARKRRLTASLCALLSCLSVCAQTDTLPQRVVVTHAQQFALGYTNILDTYLSPENHTGTELRYISHTTRQKPRSRYSHQWVHQGSLSTVEDRSGKSSELAGLYDLSYALHHNWPLDGGKWHLQAGGMCEAGIGFIYNTRNQNNPAQLRLFCQLSPAAAATYHFRVLGVGCDARYEVSATLVGLMFSPNYGQSYYEIFTRGNYDHNCVPTTVFSAPSLHNMLSIDIQLRSTTLRVGYLGDFQQSEVNHLKQHVYTHALMVGWVKRIEN